MKKFKFQCVFLKNLKNGRLLRCVAGKPFLAAIILLLLGQVFSAVIFYGYVLKELRRDQPPAETPLTWNEANYLQIMEKIQEIREKNKAVSTSEIRNPFVAEK